MELLENWMRVLVFHVEILLQSVKIVDFQLGTSSCFIHPAPEKNNKTVRGCDGIFQMCNERER